MTDSAKERVEIELRELEQKAVKLGGFIISDKFNKLSRRAQDLLSEQFGTMCRYATILRERLEIWE